MENSKTISTLVQKGLKLSKNDCPTNDKEKLNIPYAPVVGSIMYGMWCNKPDINFVVGLVSHTSVILVPNTGTQWKEYSGI